MSGIVVELELTEWDEAVREATRRIVSVANPQTVLLFGSAARGEIMTRQNVNPNKNLRIHVMRELRARSGPPEALQ